MCYWPTQVELVSDDPDTAFAADRACRSTPPLARLGFDLRIDDGRTRE